jgi:hypothetical protein
MKAEAARRLLFQYVKLSSLMMTTCYLFTLTHSLTHSLSLSLSLSLSIYILSLYIALSSVSLQLSQAKPSQAEPIRSEEPKRHNTVDKSVTHSLTQSVSLPILYILYNVDK